MNQVKVVNIIPKQESIYQIHVSRLYKTKKNLSTT